MAFTVVNTSGRPLEGRARIGLDGSAGSHWFIIEGEPTRSFVAGAVEHFIVRIAAPWVAPPGTYRFRLLVLADESPDDLYGESPWIVFDVTLPPLQPAVPAPVRTAEPARVRPAEPAAAAPLPPPPSPVMTPPRSGSAARPPRSAAQLVVEEIRGLATGTVLFNPPARMRAGVRERVEVRIAIGPPTAQLREGLKGHGAPQAEPIQVGTFMKVRLLGERFDVRALSSEEQVVVEEHPSQWEWDVTALHHGTQVLSLAVSVRLKIRAADEERMDHPVFDRSIEVSVNPPYAVRRFVGAYWQWIVGTIVGSGIIGWLWQSWTHR